MIIRLFRNRYDDIAYLTADYTVAVEAGIYAMPTLAAALELLERLGYAEI